MKMPRLSIVERRVLEKIKPSDFEGGYPKKVKGMVNEEKKAMREKLGKVVTYNMVVASELNPIIKCEINAFNGIMLFNENHPKIKYFKKDEKGTINYDLKNLALNKKTNYAIKIKNQTGESVHFTILETILEGRTVKTKDGKYEYVLNGISPNYFLVKKQLHF
ncbi:MAG: hypothetical protein JW703_04310 [Candidatus Diapherotrites archaeon]|nr:hypothetical protein [Candidatus Diapherotrites archaeon]